jgi:hypothetical protein
MLVLLHRQEPQEASLGKIWNRELRVHVETAASAVSLGRSPAILIKN